MRLRNQLRLLRRFERQGEALATPVFRELLLNYSRSICDGRRVSESLGYGRGRRRHPERRSRPLFCVDVLRRLCVNSAKFLPSARFFLQDWMIVLDLVSVMR